MTKKNWLTLILLFTLATGLYIAGSKRENTETSNWQIYSNQELGIEFKYPPTWDIQTYPYSDDFLVITLDPVRAMTYGEIKGVDTNGGLISFYLSNEECKNFQCKILANEPLDVRIGENNSITAKKHDQMNINSPNPSYEGTHEINYFFNYAGDKYYSGEIRYVSDPTDKNLADFNKIISTLRIR